MQGTVKKVLVDKNFGFISQEGTDKDIFFHRDKLDGVRFEDIKEGDTVTFDVERTDKGPAAANVKKV